MTTRRTATAQQMKKRSGQPIEVELPSGFVVKVRRPGMEKFLSAGFLPDHLTNEVQKMIGSRNNSSTPDIAKVLSSFGEEGIESMFRMVNRVVSYCMVDPPVIWHERARLEVDESGRRVPIKDDHGQPILESIPESDRDPESLYSDEMDIEDKMFVMQFAAGGSSDLDQFRKESSAAMDALQTGGG